MGNKAIQLDGIGKNFRIGKLTKPPSGNKLLSKITAPTRYLFNVLREKSSTDVFWALKEISFDVKHGEVLGIIGHNGAGKSTLLKILSRITEPSEGKAEIYGRVGSLLEVGTGFHPELTGRENIFLNGAILGMKKNEIQRKFDQIIAFAEVERFLDTPVKRYSSGMFVRLAFAVAAHLEPEILIIDEVLAVGDTAFQKKCLGKIGDVAKGGRTVLFVSHNMAAISNLCSKTIMLQNGRIELYGNTKDVVNSYVKKMQVEPDVPLSARTDREGTGRFRFTGVSAYNEYGEKVSIIEAGQPLRLVLDYKSSDGSKLTDVSVSVDFMDMFGQKLFQVGTSISGGDFKELPAEGRLVCNIPKLLLVEEQYRLDLWASVNDVIADYIQQTTMLGVLSTHVTGTRAKQTRRKHGIFMMPHSWDKNEKVLV